MSNVITSDVDPRQPTVYRIRVKGHLGPHWSDWFGGLAITLEDNGDTLLTGPMVDQAALHGLLKRVRDLGMPLVSISPVNLGLDDSECVKQKRKRTATIDYSNPIQEDESVSHK